MRKNGGDAINIAIIIISVTFPVIIWISEKMMTVTVIIIISVTSPVIIWIIDRMTTADIIIITVTSPVIIRVERMVTLVIITISVTFPVITIIERRVTSAMAWKLSVLPAGTQPHLDMSMEGGMAAEVMILMATPAQGYSE